MYMYMDSKNFSLIWAYELDNSRCLQSLEHVQGRCRGLGHVARPNFGLMRRPFFGQL